MSEQLVKVRMLRDWDGWTPGQEVEVPAGIADAYCNWANAAVFVEAPKQELAAVEEDVIDKSLDAPPANKAILGPGKARRTK